jgi:hypothetical protein
MIEIYARYYIRNGRVVLEFRKEIYDQNQIKQILLELLRKGEIYAVVRIKSPVTYLKIINLLRFLNSRKL